MPPHNGEAEQALLGALLFNNAAYGQVRGFLLPQHFAEPVHGRIYAAIGKLIERGQTANSVTLKNRFDQDGALSEIGGAAYLARLAASIVSIVNTEDYGWTIHDLFLRRQLIVLGEEIVDDAHGVDLDRPASEILADISTRLARLSTATSRARSERRVAEDICDILKQPRQIYPTGIDTLDAALQGGFIPGRLYGIGARMKAGKSMLLGTISYNLNQAGVRHLFVSLEISAEEVVQRNIARHFGFNAIRFLKREHADFVAGKAGDYAVLAADNTMFEHIPAASFDRLRSVVARSIHAGAAGVFVDYLQLVGGRERYQTEEQHLRDVAQWLADIGRKFGVFVVVACQLNQEGNVRGGEGLKLAADAYLTLEHDEDRSDLPGRWMKMWHSRFSLNEDVGSASAPGLWRHDDAGPHSHILRHATNEQFGLFCELRAQALGALDPGRRDKSEAVHL